MPIPARKYAHLICPPNADGSQNGKILRLDPSTGRATTLPMTDSGKSLGSITLGPDGNIRFVDDGAEQFGKITPNATVMTMSPPQVGSGVPIPGGVGERRP